jgi:hypothetical protein
MNQMDVIEIWLQSKDHINNILSQADSHEKMLLFTKTMCDYYKTNGCSEGKIEELRLLIGARCLHYALNLKTRDEQIIDEYKKVIFEPGKEECLIVPRLDMHRVTDMLDDRNGQLVPEERKRRKTKKGIIKYRVVR